MADQGTGVGVVLPENARVIMLDTAYCSPKEYARRTGKSPAAVSQLIARGKLPMRPKDEGGTANDINLAALWVEALQAEDSDVQIVALA